MLVVNKTISEWHRVKISVGGLILGWIYTTMERLELQPNRSKVPIGFI